MDTALYYDLSIRALTDQAGNILPSFRPSLVFGDRTTWGIRILNAGQPADLSGVMAWTAAVAEDLNPGTRPMCRTTSGISEDEGVVSVPLDTQTDTFCGATANRGPRNCLFELCGLDGDGGVAVRVAFHAVCRMETDPGASGDLVPIETTDMTSSQVQAIATDAAREEVAEIQGEIEQAKTDAEEAAEAAQEAAEAAEEAAEAAQEAAESIPTTEGATAGQVLTIQEDGSAAYSDPEGGEIDSELSTASENPVQNRAIASAVNGINAKIPQAATAQNQLADKEFVNSSINALAAFPITRDAQKDPFRTRGELLAATTYYSGGEVRVPTRNDYAFVQSDEYYGAAVDGYSDFALTEEYVGYYVLVGYEKTMVTAANKDDLGIVPGTTVPYVELPSTRYIYNGTGFEFQFIVNQSGLTAVQLAALNSGITAEKVALIGTAIQSSEKNAANGVAGLDGAKKIQRDMLYTATTVEYGVVRGQGCGVRIYHSGSSANNGSLYCSGAVVNDIDSRSPLTNLAYWTRNCCMPIVPAMLDYAVRSVSPLVTALPADTASPIALTDASATTRNHSWTYTHSPDTAPTYQLPAVTDSTISHQIDLTVTFSSTALSCAFQDAEGTTITPQSTPAIQAGTVIDYLCEYIAGEWVVMPLVIKE